MVEKTERLVFGNSLANKPAGCSASKMEYIENRQDSKWDKLNSIPEWRKCLSSLHSHNILEIDGLKYKTPEHYFQYKKFYIANPDFARRFCVGGEFGDSDGKMIRKLRKKIMLTAEQWKEWEMIENECKDIARKAKFCPGNLCYDTLMATGSVELWSYAPRCGTFRMYKMEEYRNHLNTK